MENESRLLEHVGLSVFVCCCCNGADISNIFAPSLLLICYSQLLWFSCIHWNVCWCELMWAPDDFGDIFSSSASGARTQCCHILMEPVCRRQKLLPEFVSVCLTAVLQDWDSSSLIQATSESWVLHSSNKSAPAAQAFQHLLMELSASCLHVVRHRHHTEPRLKLYSLLSCHETTLTHRQKWPLPLNDLWTHSHHFAAVIRCPSLWCAQTRE